MAGHCVFYKGSDGKVEPNGFHWRLDDIEDLYHVGLRHRVCPYYLQKTRAATADVVLMPYNYLIDAKTRESFQIRFENSIIILDEAHNIERVSEEAASFDLNL